MRLDRTCLSLCLVTSACSAAPPATAQPRVPAPAPIAPPLIEAELADDAAVAAALREHYTKYEYRIPMRDGAKLHTGAYVPKDRSRTYPILLVRTPYSVMPYGVDNYPAVPGTRNLRRIAPSPLFVRDGFILVHQDVRGRLMSEGTFVNVRPRSPGGVDETTDAWDTVDWLVENLPANNGRVGVWGISYPGFYAAQAAVDAHPALAAVSPQAPVTDWFAGDDFHHNGAFMLGDAFPFFANFGQPRPEPTKRARWDFEYEAGDAYEFFLRMGPLANANARYLHGEIPFWNEIMAHGVRDGYWQARNPRPHYRNVKPAVMTVGGWFDAENLFGALATYRAFESQSPGADNRMVMGPWSHGGWSRETGDRHGDVSFGAKTSSYYQQEIELPFFRRHLKGDRTRELPEAQVFETGTNLWQRFDRWPPKGARSASVYFGAGGSLTTARPTDTDGFEQYLSDPAKPVPYRGRPSREIESDYMSGDQRFAARRPDVLVYATGPLEQDVTLAGPLEAALWVSTTGTDADFVVKLVDVYPPDHADPEPNPTSVRLGGYQQLVRGEIMRGKFRNSLEVPEPFEPGEPTLVRFALPDVCHSFRSGHRIMIQVQSSWFPLADRNPQVFTNIYGAKASDFRAATHRVFRTATMPSGLKVTLAPGSAPPPSR
ncbi:MAG: CocE/NonD family hydrolase [Deltaproteobacteria bacterium]|jgi:putative CocE/NonD family hydrolase|nr:CocE/NonD family hydrolase [Deltaproteobacteria bacterium]MBW2537727.1 CocE/NonD family hydrolase [Deltaproteobacteria bacterium]